MPVREPEVDTSAQPKIQVVDKEWARQQLAASDAVTGFVPVPGATAEMAQRMTAESMRARGIDPDAIYYEQDED